MFFKTRPKIEEFMFIVMDKSAREEKFSQPLQNINNPLKAAVLFLTGYNGISNVKNKNIRFIFAMTIIRYGFFQITILQAAYELEKL